MTPEVPMSDAALHFWEAVIGLAIGAVIVLAKCGVRVHWQHTMFKLAAAGDAEAAAKLKALPPPQIIGSGPTILLAFAASCAIAPHLLKPAELRAQRPVPQQVAQRDGERQSPELPARAEDVVLWRRRP